MQVWKHLQKQLPGNRGDQEVHKELPPSPPSLSTPSICLGDSGERRTSASTFYLAYNDDDNDESGKSIMTTMSSKCNNALDSNSAQSQSQTPINTSTSHTDRNRNTTTADVKPIVQPKPNKPKKPQQQQQLADGAADIRQKQSPALVMRSTDTLYPSEFVPSAEQPVQERTPSAAKPLPPVCY